MYAAQADPYASLVTKLKAGEFPPEDLEGLLGHLASYVRNNHAPYYAEADDLASEVVLEAYESIDNYRGDALFFSWLVGIACNLIRQRARKKRLPQHSWDDLPDTLPDAAASACRVQEQQEDRQLFKWDFQEAFETLAQEEQTIFRMRTHEQISFKEIAERTGKNAAAARQIYFRVCRKLRNHPVEAGWGHFQNTGA